MSEGVIEIVRNIGFCRIEKERKNLTFFKIFRSDDLSSENMRSLPNDFIRKVSQKDFSRKMVIRTHWGSSWELKISMNTRFYYMEKRGWYQFVSDNALGKNEFITFTHKGKMCFNVNIYEQNGKEMITPRKPQKMASSSRFRKEQVETGESMRGAEIKIRKKKIKSKKVENTVPEFISIIRKSYLKFLAIPRNFAAKHIGKESKIFTIHHSNGNASWKVLCLVRENRTNFSMGWIKLVKNYPLLIGDICNFKLIKPTEFLLVVSKKAEENISP